MPATGSYFGSPVSRIISAGTLLTNTWGSLSAESFLPGRAALTSFQLSSLGSLAKLSGSFTAATQGPLRSGAWSQLCSLRR